ncbi:unnamed protein product, partial [Heterosigma akashiwo]
MMEQGMRMAVVESNADTELLAAATFRTNTSGPDGNKLSVGCLVKVNVPSGNPSTLQVAVRSTAAR